MSELESKLWNVIHEEISRFDSGLADLAAGKAAIACAKVAQSHFQKLADATKPGADAMRKGQHTGER